MLMKDAARRDAEWLLREHWDGTFPVDPVAIAEELGIEVIFGTLREGTSGAIIAEGEDVQILISEDDPMGRQTFTCAHELGHYQERRRARDPEYSFEDTRRPGEYDLHEFYADEFAGNLLMPERRFLDVYAHNIDERTLAAYFAVSPTAVRKRIARLSREGKL